VLSGGEIIIFVCCLVFAQFTSVMDGQADIGVTNWPNEYALNVLRSADLFFFFRFAAVSSLRANSLGFHQQDPEEHILAPNHVVATSLNRVPPLAYTLENSTHVTVYKKTIIIARHLTAT
jgi:hypothetical protein